MSSPKLSDDILGEVAQFLDDRRTQCSLALASKSLSRIICPILYIHITVRVGTPGNLLAHTLSNQPEIALMVQSLEFESAADDSNTSGPQWDEALAAMLNLKRLSITRGVDFGPSTTARIRFRLTSFTCLDRVVTAGIIQMLEHQDEVDTVVLAAGFEEQNIELKSSFLPRLRRLSAPPAAVARFAPGRPLEDIHMLKSDPTALARPDIPVLTSAIIPLVRLRLMAPHLSGLTWGSSLEDSSACSIREITVVQDRIWGMHRPKAGLLGAILGLARVRDRFPQLHRMVVVSSLSSRTGQEIFEQVQEKFQNLEEFHFCGLDKCTTWRGWAVGSLIKSVTSHKICEGRLDYFSTPRLVDTQRPAVLLRY
ncbi:hypothetical protein C8J57DRAFT_1384387 [Mycena rebaudengoi]|nr:hypothetical protein C8J57DRAFT_1384387 [Mycena rebaudengoi]